MNKYYNSLLCNYTNIKKMSNIFEKIIIIILD